jgi:tRNA threonylcarbamoyladenosine biosynthesis protein TsaB
MALILNIETSTEVCSVSLSRDGSLLFAKLEKNGPSHASLIGPFVDEALKIAESIGLKPDAVAVSSGPGSYTGLRIGVSMAKGICFALGIPLISVPTLELIADTLINKTDVSENSLIRPVLDARRMEVYTALYDAKGNCLEEPSAMIIDNESFSEELKKGYLYIAGNGAEKIKSVVLSDNAGFETDLYPDAANMINIAERKFEQSLFENVAYFEPFYLKEFIATVPKKKVF